MLIEEWKPVPGYEGLYEVSTYGNVRRASPSHLKPAGALIAQKYVNKTGYLSVTLSKDGRQRSWLVHRLVLMVHDRMPLSGEEANHKNGIRDDNRLENLEWVTRSGNLKHSYDRLNRWRPVGVRAHNAKLTPEQVTEIRELAALGFSSTQIISKLSLPVNASNVRMIVRNETWK